MPEVVCHSTINAKGNAMGLLDSILGKVAGGASGGIDPKLISTVMGLLGDSKSGGLNGLIESFTKNGLGDIISSWVGTGKNLPISAEQITKALGQGKIGQLASQTGLSKDDLTKHLSGILPGIVDKLTPQGKVPEGDLLQQGLNLLKGNFKF
jgi:uncharacterized protein YidB (DUF937 family)